MIKFTFYILVLFETLIFIFTDHSITPSLMEGSCLLALKVGAGWGRGIYRLVLIDFKFVKC